MKIIQGLALAALLVVAPACGSSSQSGGTPSPSAQPTASAGGTPSASPSGPPAGFLCADAAGGSAQSGSVATARAGQQSGFDRFVIEFADSVPGYTVMRQPSPAFTQSPRGTPVNLAGTAGILVTIRNVANWTAYAGPTRLTPGYRYLKEALMVQNFEGVQQWGLGVQGTQCLHVYTLTGPSRLVVDMAPSA